MCGTVYRSQTVRAGSDDVNAAAVGRIGLGWRVAGGREEECKPHHGLLSISLRHLLPTKDMVN